MTEAALADPTNGIIEIAGPMPCSFPDLMRGVLTADSDTRTVVGDEQARYFGTRLTDTSITPGPDAHLAETSFADRLAANPK